MQSTVSVPKEHAVVTWWVTGLQGRYHVFEADQNTYVTFIRWFNVCPQQRNIVNHAIYNIAGQLPGSASFTNSSILITRSMVYTRQNLSLSQCEDLDPAKFCTSGDDKPALQSSAVVEALKPQFSGFQTSPSNQSAHWHKDCSAVYNTGNCGSTLIR